MNQVVGNLPLPASDSTNDLAELQRGIDGLLGDLATPIAQIDTCFVAVGDTLADCAALLGKVTSVFEALPADLSGEDMRQATDKLGAIIRQAEDISSSFEAEQEDLGALQQRVTTARTPMSALRKAIQLIGIVAINARVVAATIAGEREEFDVFTTDIAELARDATRTIELFARAYEQLSTDVGKATEQRLRFQKTQQGALRQASIQLARNLDQVSQHQKRAAETSTETSRITRDVSSRVGATVIALQVGDSTRQRIEHVANALEGTKHLLDHRHDPAFDAARTGEEANATLYVLGELLAAALSDYDRDVASAESALRGLGDDANAILSISRDLYGQQDGQGASALGSLGADIRVFARLFEACDTDRQQLDKAVMAVGETVDKLLSHVNAVKTIESNMRLVTLNAAVKCAQLGPRGRALDVISTQLRELTANTVEAAEATLLILNEASTRAGNMIARSDGCSLKRIELLIGNAMEAIGLFEHLDQRMSAAMSLLDEQGKLVDQAFAEAARRFAGHAGISEALADARTQAVALAATMDRKDIQALASRDSGSALFAQLRKTYTMESERRVHDALIGQTAPVEPEPEVQSEDDDLGIDFF